MVFYFKWNLGTIKFDELVFQIYVDFGFCLKEFLQCLFAYLYWKDAVLEAVAVKDICKRGRYYYSKSVILQRPDSMLSTRTTTKVVSCKQDLGVFVFKVV